MCLSYSIYTSCNMNYFFNIFPVSAVIPKREEHAMVHHHAEVVFNMCPKMEASSLLVCEDKIRTIYAGRMGPRTQAFSLNSVPALIQELEISGSHFLCLDTLHGCDR
ncbi:hypothetical protein C4D60_Mb08t28460 [Musa balbisiana]|uniref:Uncharacterized protein n=1 Tax=Musa balbisiana TaxID=52838 RepID=A0A4S8K744_MUSBA|nr:hypothetical protein C4D60_Mb08t28460 [Musa balbisiana]